MSAKDARKNPFMHWRGVLLLPLIVSVAWISSVVTSEATVLDMALGLGVLMVLAAILNWRIGLVAAAVAALSLNYFHVEPRHSLIIRSAGDIGAVVILAIIGIAVSFAARAFVRRELIVVRSNDIRFRHSRILDGLSTAVPVTQLWIQVVNAAEESLDWLDVRIADEFDQGLPRLSRWTRFEGDDDSEGSSLVTIPPRGALVDFRDPRVRSHLVVQPRNTTRGVAVSRRILNNFLDDLETVIGSG